MLQVEVLCVVAGKYRFRGPLWR